VQQSQREREKEAIFRGEEVADAIRIYYGAQLRNGRPAGDTALPTDLDQLVEGVPSRANKEAADTARVAAHDHSQVPASGLCETTFPEITILCEALCSTPVMFGLRQ